MTTKSKRQSVRRKRQKLDDTHYIVVENGRVILKSKDSHGAFKCLRENPIDRVMFYRFGRTPARYKKDVLDEPTNPVAKMAGSVGDEFLTLVVDTLGTILECDYVDCDTHGTINTYDPRTTRAATNAEAVIWTVDLPLHLRADLRNPVPGALAKQCRKLAKLFATAAEQLASIPDTRNRKVIRKLVDDPGYVAALVAADKTLNEQGDEEDDAIAPRLREREANERATAKAVKPIQTFDEASAKNSNAATAPA